MRTLVAIKVLLKTTITKDNMSDFDEMFNYARKNEVRFFSSGTLTTNREAGKRQAKDVSLSYDEYTNLIWCTYEKCGVSFVDTPELNNASEFATHTCGMQCGAGTNSFAVNWKGEMQPCITFNQLKYSLDQMSVKSAWEKISEWSNDVPQLVECQTCKYQLMCIPCVIYHYADTHEFGKPSPRLCYKVQHGITD